jgi:hypothetical protein
MRRKRNWTGALLAGGAGLLVVASLFLQSADAAQPPSSDWRPVFDGRSTSGWKQVGMGNFKLENGALVTDGGPGLLWYTREKFGNCQLRIIFKPTRTNDNSGVYIRLPDGPTKPSDGIEHGYEVEINDIGDTWHRTGCLHNKKRALSLVSANVGDWNTMIVTLFGPRTRVQVNGVTVVDYLEVDPPPNQNILDEPEKARRPDAGYIGLENYGEGARVFFKDVSVRALK